MNVRIPKTGFFLSAELAKSNSWAVTSETNETHILMGVVFGKGSTGVRTLSIIFYKLSVGVYWLSRDRIADIGKEVKERLDNEQYMDNRR